MTDPRLGKLERPELRTVWEREDTEFTPWLEKNISLLNDALGIEIEQVQREEPVGDFAVDLFAKEAGSDRKIIIENQLEETDHDHLGKLLTYAAGLEAVIVIWISPQFSDEHRRALDWLNSHTAGGLSFFGVELELFRIGDSPPAPNFKVVAQPSDWLEQLRGRVEGKFSERELAYHEFFDGLLNQLKSRSPSFTPRSRVGNRRYLNFGGGRTGFTFETGFFAGNRFYVCLYTDTGEKEANKRAFDLLFRDKERIEKNLGALSWERRDDKRSCSVLIYREGSIGSPSETLGTLKDWAVEQLLKFKEVFGPKIKTLNLEAPSEEQP